MKKIILIGLLPITIIMAGSFVMTEGNPLIKADITEFVDPTPINPTTTSDWTPKALPTQKFNVLDYGLKGDGVTDDSAALKELANNTDVTNWYFSAGKTFLLSGIKIPKHVKFVFGGGTIVSKNYDPSSKSESCAYGALIANNTVVVDGINFRSDSKRTFYGCAYYGQILISRHGESDSEGFASRGIEIRNSTFESKYRKADSISVYTGHYGEAKHENLKIYNNTFTNSGHFFMEIGDRTADHSDSQNALPGLEIFNNTFTGGSAISLSRIRNLSGAKVHHNTFSNCTWGIELAVCDGVEVYNNLMLDISKHPIVANGPQTSTLYTDESDYKVGRNIIHHNHFETSGSNALRFINLYSCNRDEWYGNYIKSRIKMEKISSSSAPVCYGPHLHDNTFVEGDSSWIIFYKDSVNGKIENNNIYGTRDTAQTAVSITSSASDTIVNNNNIYMRSGSSVCVSGVSGGNKCVKSYTDNIPISRTGAGLK